MQTCGGKIQFIVHIQAVFPLFDGRKGQKDIAIQEAPQCRRKVNQTIVLVGGLPCSLLGCFMYIIAMINNKVTSQL